MIELEVTGKSRNIRTEGIDRSFKLVEEDIPVVLRGQLISVARQLLITEQRAGNFPKTEYVTLVDNKLNSNERAVKPFGIIEYKTKLQALTPVLLFAMQAIFQRSPERTGAYSANHVLFKNNVFVAKGFSNIISYINSDTQADPGDIYRFVNVTPYARKLERQRTTKQTRGKYKGQNRTKGVNKRLVKGKIATIPAGAYVLANRAIRRKFKELKNNIRFSFIPIDPGTARRLDSSGRDTTGYVFAKSRANGRGAGRPYLYPSITITAAKNAVSFNRGFTEQAGLWVQNY